MLQNTNIEPCAFDIALYNITLGCLFVLLSLADHQAVVRDQHAYNKRERGDIQKYFPPLPGFELVPWRNAGVPIA